jgi:hypothetical protein
MTTATTEPVPSLPPHRPPGDEPILRVENLVKEFPIRAGVFRRRSAR